MTSDDFLRQELDYLLAEFRFGVLALEGACSNLPEGSPTVDDIEAIVARMNTAMYMVNSGEIRVVLKAEKIQMAGNLLH